MRAATRERIISIMALVLVISICSFVSEGGGTVGYSKMAPIDQYLMDLAEAFMRWVVS